MSSYCVILDAIYLYVHATASVCMYEVWWALPWGALYLKWQDNLIDALIFVILFSLNADNLNQMWNVGLKQQGVS